MIGGKCVYFTLFILCLIGIITYFCPCYIFGKAAESVGDSCILCGLVYFVGPVNLYARTHIRGKIREKKGIDVCEAIYNCFSSVMLENIPENAVPTIGWVYNDSVLSQSSQNYESNTELHRLTPHRIIQYMIS